MAATDIETEKIDGISNPIWILNDHNSPIFTAQIRIKGGISLDPFDRDGLTSLWSDMVLRGTDTRSFAQITQFMKDHAIAISIGAGRDDTLITLKAPSVYTEQAITLLHDVLLNPSFDEAELKRIKDVFLAGFNNNLGDADWRGQRIINGTIYENSVYARPGSGSLNTLKNINADDITTRHEQFMSSQPDHMVVVGNIDQDHLEKLASIWTQKSKAPDNNDFKDFRSINTDTKIHHSFDVVQSKLYYLLPALAPNDPNYVAQVVLNYALTSGFGAPLMEGLREQSGLSYGVGAYTTSPDHGGLWVISVDVPTARFNEALSIIQNTLTDTASGNTLTPQDIEDAKTALIASLPMGWTSSDAITSALSSAYAKNFKPNYLADYTQKLTRVTYDDVINVLQKVMNQDHRLVVSVGRKAPDEGWTILTDLPNMQGNE